MTTSAELLVPEVSSREARVAHGAAILLQVLFAGWVLLCGLAITAQLAQRSLLQRLLVDPFAVTPGELRAGDAWRDALNTGALVLVVITGVVFITWCFLEHRRVDRLGRGTGLRSGWAIAGWFVPFANLYVPYRVTADIWNGTVGWRAGRSGAGRHVHDSRTSPLVLTWWVGCIGGVFLLRHANSAAQKAKTLSDVLSANAVYLTGDLVVLVTAILALMIVRRVSRTRVEAGGRYGARRETPTRPPEPPAAIRPR
jgi:hypothetical protein